MDLLVDRLTSKHDEPCLLRQGCNLQILILATLREVNSPRALVLLVLTLDLDTTLEDDDERVPSGWDGMLVSTATLLEDKVDEVGRCPAVDGTLDAKDLTSDHLGGHAQGCVLTDRDCLCQELLVAWFTELILGLKIDP